MANVAPLAEGATKVMAQMPYAIWRANAMANFRTTTIESGFPSLDAELHNGGWPRSCLIELLVQQDGIGEMQLLKPALAQLSNLQRIALIQPPYFPHGSACRNWGLRAESLLWIKTKASADALWAAEQTLKNGSCGAVLLWQKNIRSDSLRRLNLAAQTTDTWFWLLRPMAARQDTSPASLRIALRPAFGGVSADVFKRRGPHLDQALFIPLADMPSSKYLPDPDHETMDQRSLTPAAARSPQTLLV
jgi:protein ImuA